MSTQQLLCLRPHHGLCIRHFTGKGYSPAFVTNMEQVIARLCAAPETEIALTAGADVLCACCPHNQNGRCASAPKPAQYDAAVLRLCGLEVGKRLPWREFQQQVETRVLSEGLLQEVCKDCQWLSLCEKQNDGKERYEKYKMYIK